MREPERHQLGDPSTYAAAVLNQGQAIGFPLVSLLGATILAGEANWRAWVEGAPRRQLVQALGVLVAQAQRERGVGEV